MDVLQYQPGFESDLALLAWWLHLGETGDLEKIFFRSACCLSVFTQQFQAPSELYYTKDEKGWNAAMWFWPLMDGALISMWGRKDMRRTPKGLKIGHALFQKGFAKYPVLLFTTRNPGILEHAKLFGFSMLGEIPYLFDGETAIIATATPFSYEAAVNSPALQETY